jgi:hypothetical protein
LVEGNWAIVDITLDGDALKPGLLAPVEVRQLDPKTISNFMP